MTAPSLPDAPQTHTTTLERQYAAAQCLDESLGVQLTRACSGLSPAALAVAYTDWGWHWWAAPARQSVLAQRAWELAWQAYSEAAQPSESTAQEKDPRFADPAWVQWPFNTFRAFHKATETWCNEALQRSSKGVSPHHQHMVDFFTRQALAALSPSNGLWSNPEALRLAQQTQGKSLQDGQNFFWQDVREYLEADPDTPCEALQPLEFAVGRDVACTPGQVVFRNPLIELIEYSPTTQEVLPEPVLIVPSCIMKYYILDLSPHNSMVKYLVGQGHRVFIVSWRNPDASDRDLGVQDYLRSGLLAAMSAVRSRCAATRIHAVGYCLGGTFLAMVAAALGRRARRQEQGKEVGGEDGFFPAELPELASIVLLAAQTDFAEPGELGVFIDPAQLHALRQRVQEQGYLSGREMGGSFVYLAARDLLWGRNTRRYLLGEDDVSFDLMGWNTDTTRLPARMHSEYLSSLFLNNALALGHYRIAGARVALSDIAVPILAVATARDHVSPWRSVYKIHLQTEAPITFVLAAGGHNAGIVSEPGRARRSYQIASTPEGAGNGLDPDAWAAQTPVVQGSWWEAMHAWLRTHSGAPVQAQPLDGAGALCEAPGSYVMVRYAD